MAYNHIFPPLFIQEGQVTHSPLVTFIVSLFVGHPQGNKKGEKKTNTENKALPAFPLFVEDNKRRQPKKESQIKG